MHKLTLQVEASSYEELMDKVEAALGVEFKPVAGTRPPIAETLGAFKQNTEALAATAAVATLTAQGATPAASVPLPMPAPKRKYTRRTANESAPAAAPNDGSVPSGAAAGIAAPQAQVGNSAGVQAADPAAGGAVTVAAPAAPAAGGAVTYDAMKAKLQEIAARNGGAGLKDAAAVLGTVTNPDTGTPYVKIKDVKPEHFAAVHKAAVHFLTTVPA